MMLRTDREWDISELDDYHLYLLQTVVDLKSFPFIGGNLEVPRGEEIIKAFAVLESLNLITITKGDSLFYEMSATDMGMVISRLHGTRRLTI